MQAVRCFLEMKLKNNVQVGVVIYGGGYPRFGDIAPDKPGINIVEGNDLTQILAVCGHAFLGYLNRDCVNGLGGQNIISNTNPDVPLCVTVERSQLVAMQTEWGLATVTPEDFIYDENSEIIFHCLNQTAQNEREAMLWLALEERGASMYTNAIEIYRAILRDFAYTKSNGSISRITSNVSVNARSRIIARACRNTEHIFTNIATITSQCGNPTRRINFTCAGLWQMGRRFRSIAAIFFCFKRRTG